MTTQLEVLAAGLVSQPADTAPVTPGPGSTNLSWTLVVADLSATATINISLWASDDGSSWAPLDWPGSDLSLPSDAYPSIGTGIDIFSWAGRQYRLRVAPSVPVQMSVNAEIG